MTVVDTLPFYKSKMCDRSVYNSLDGFVVLTIRYFNLILSIRYEEGNVKQGRVPFLLLQGLFLP